MAKAPVPPREFWAPSIVALGEDHLRMLAVYPAVPWRDGKPDLGRWAELADLPLRRVTDLWSVLWELGACLPDGNLPEMIRGYVSKRAKDLIGG